MFSALVHPTLEKKIREKSLDIDPYYIKKYEYLKEYGYFEDYEASNFKSYIDDEMVKESLLQVEQIVFETTDHCNLNCPYCSLGEMYDFAKKERKTINTHYAINFLKYIFDLKPPKTKLGIGFFGGEPLVNFDFIKKIVEEVKQLNTDKELDIEYNMTTNATLMRKHIPFLVEHNFVLLISLDGDEKGHSYRVYAKNNKNSFSEVIKNVDILQRDYPAYFVDKVSFNAVLHNRNSIKDIYTFIYNRYNKIPRVAQLAPGGINPEMKDLYESMFHNRMKSEREFENEGSSLLPIARDGLILYRELSKFLNKDSINSYISNLLNLLYAQISVFPTSTCFPFEKKYF